jgi:diadenosine tetraphosphate (Ap4A) HIT family hydrolase
MIPMNEHSDCLGCKLANKIYLVHVVYEDEHVCCILDHDPYNEGHTLILPKKHFLDADELDMDTAGSIMRASILISKSLKDLYQPDGITVNQNGGIFNDLGHYHMHVVPRYKGHSFESFYNDVPFENSEEKARLPQTASVLKSTIDKKIGQMP